MLSNFGWAKFFCNCILFGLKGGRALVLTSYFSMTEIFAFLTAQQNKQHCIALQGYWKNILTLLHGKSKTLIQIRILSERKWNSKNNVRCFITLLHFLHNGVKFSFWCQLFMIVKNAILEDKLAWHFFLFLVEKMPFRMHFIFTWR